MKSRLITLALLGVLAVILAANALAEEAASDGKVLKDCRYVFTIEDVRAWNLRDPANRDFDIVKDGCSYKKYAYYQEGFQYVPLGVAVSQRALTMEEKDAAEVARQVHNASKECRRFYSRNSIVKYLLTGQVDAVKKASVTLPSCVQRFGKMAKSASAVIGEASAPAMKAEVSATMTPKVAQRLAEVARENYIKCRGAYTVKELTEYILTGGGSESRVISRDLCIVRAKRIMGYSTAQ